MQKLLGPERGKVNKSLLSDRKVFRIVGAVTSSCKARGDTMSAEGPDDTVRPLRTNRNWPKLRPVLVLSTLGSAAAVAAVGVFCAMFYLILKGKSAQRVVLTK